MKPRPIDQTELVEIPLTNPPTPPPSRYSSPSYPSQHSSSSSTLALSSKSWSHIQISGEKFLLHNGPLKSVQFCNAQSSREIFDEHPRTDEYSDLWKRLLLHRKHGPAPAIEEAARFFKDNLRDWNGFYTQVCKNAVEVINARFNEKNIQLDDLTEHLYLCRTDGAENARIGHYTMGRAIFIISDAGGFYKLCLFSILQLFSTACKNQFYLDITHEFFHVWSRMHPKAREDMYNRLGFLRCEIELPEEISKARLFNPDEPYTVRKKVQLNDGSTGWAMELAVIDPDICTFDGHFTRTAGEIPLPTYLKIVWLQLEEESDNQWRYVKDEAGKPVYLSTPPDLSKEFGVGYTIHPEEILAQNFVGYVWPELTKEPGCQVCVELFHEYLAPLNFRRHCKIGEFI